MQYTEYTVPVELSEEQVWIVLIALCHWSDKESDAGNHADASKALQVARLINNAQRNMLAQKMSELAERSSDV